MQIFESAGRYTQPEEGEPNHWIKHVGTEDLSMGTYSIPEGGVDDQGPHNEDEIYVVHTGTATMVTDSGSAVVKPGSVIFIAAGEAHRFSDVQEDFSVIGIFAPPLGSRQAVR